MSRRTEVLLAMLAAGLLFLGGEWHGYKIGRDIGRTEGAAAALDMAAQACAELLQEKCKTKPPPRMPVFPQKGGKGTVL